MVEHNTYEMSINLSILDHLGVGLYSNIPAVMSEAVANAWDAEAEHVKINIDPGKEEITIEDDGHGMSIADANNKYLHIGYKRRDDTGDTTKDLQRQVMGRKGIGKLSLFSIADMVTIHSVKDGTRHGFVMDAGKIRETIEKGKTKYNPDPIDSKEIKLNKGTKIILSNLKRKIRRSSALRRRLARRFSIIDAANKFEVVLNGISISVEDRDYYTKLQYIWTFGKEGERIAALIPDVKQIKRSPNLKIKGRVEKVDGWIGTTVKAGDTKDTKSKDNINQIVIMVRGKLAQEDILSEYGETGFYSAYVIGSIHADFLDQHGDKDITTTNRQGLIEEDPRYDGLKEKIRKEMKNIQQNWQEWRNREGQATAFTFPGIEEWYGGLTHDDQKAAKKLFGRINQIPMTNDPDKRRIFISGILAFESLRYRHLLTKLDDIRVDNLDILEQVFVQLDDLEASAYYQITKDRLEIIKKLETLVDDNTIEKAVQKHLFNHLWLLEPSWDWITPTLHMETTVKNGLNSVYKGLPPEQQRARLDIVYGKAAGKHVIIELKRPGLTLTFNDVQDQIRQYRDIATTILQAQGEGGDQLELICVVGKPLKGWDNPGAEETDRKMLEQLNARIEMYGELINSAQQTYIDYTTERNKVSRIYDLITSIESGVANTLSPTEEPNEAA